MAIGRAMMGLIGRRKPMRHVGTQNMNGWLDNLHRSPIRYKGALRNRMRKGEQKVNKHNNRF